MSRKSKILCMAFSLLFVLSAVAGCTSSGQPTATPAATPTATSPATTPGGGATPAPTEPVVVAPAKPAEIFVVADTGFGDEAQQPKILEEYEKMTGIKLRLLKPPHNEYDAKLGLQLASGDVPDVCEVPSNSYMSYVKQGVFYPIRDLIYSYEPFMEANPEMFEALDYKGEIYAVQKEVGNGNITYIRGDWLDKLNMKMPTTWDEFITMLRRFRDEDPDGNGKNDTIPFISPSISQLYSGDWLQNARMDVYQTDSGEWVDGFSQPEMLEAIERLASAYQEGLIEPDIFGLSTSDARTKYYSGNVGCFTYWAGNWNGTINIELQKNLPDAYAVAMAPVADYELNNRISPLIAMPVHGNAKDPEAVFEYFIKFMYDCGEGQMWATHGVKGFTYDFVDGKMVGLASPLSPETVPSTPVGGWLNTLLRYTNFDDPFEVMPEVRSSQSLFLENSYGATLVPGVDSYTKFIADIRLLRDEAIAKAMKGTLTPQAAHDEYKTKAKQYNMDQILKELNEF